MKTISVELSERMTEEINALVESGWFADETELIRAVLREFIRHNRFGLGEQFQRDDIAWALQQQCNTQAGDNAR